MKSSDLSMKIIFVVLCSTVISPLLAKDVLDKYKGMTIPKFQNGLREESVFGQVDFNFERLNYLQTIIAYETLKEVTEGKVDARSKGANIQSRTMIKEALYRVKILDGLKKHLGGNRILYRLKSASNGVTYYMIVDKSNSKIMVVKCADEGMEGEEL